MSKRKTIARRTPINEFNPLSFNAQFASLHSKLKLQTEHFNERLDKQDVKLTKIDTSTTSLDKRVAAVETDVKVKWTRISAWAAGAAAAMTIMVNGFWKWAGGGSH